MKPFVTILFCLLFSFGYAQVVTPGNGASYTFQDLSVAYPEAVSISSPGYYTLRQSLTLSESDTLLLDANTQEIFCNNTLTITIYGTVVCAPRTDLLTITSNTTVCIGDFYDIRLEGSEPCSFSNILFEYGNNILIMQQNVSFDQCEFRYFSQPCIKYINASPVIEHCYFHDNRQAAINSAVNVTGAPIIRHNTFYHNVLNNINQPQINLGPGVAGDTIRIEDNLIEGSVTMSGGIAIANLMNVSQTCAVIRGNTIIHNRYGYTQNGSDIYAIIEGNEFRDNNLETNPMNGGSGISIYGMDENNKALLRNNVITGNLWGITVINAADVDLGTEDEWGNNHIYDNGNGGVVYDLYNNSTSDIMAVGNDWGTYNADLIEEHIVHRYDDPSLGLVTFTPFIDVDGLDESETASFEISPNPAQGRFTVEGKGKMTVSTLLGQVVLTKEIDGKETVELPRGLYVLKLGNATRKVVVE